MFNVDFGGYITCGVWVTLVVAGSHMGWLGHTCSGWVTCGGCATCGDLVMCDGWTTGVVARSHKWWLGHTCGG